ncbi:type II toxin-antitoxin system RelE/ParE family toxin [Sphingomonas sp. R86520]|uniref:type II toxin-antitoxin system RelE/ParE family toxin n=1 Tax=Sphingomonas sp. R86520 TaxID=3093859 RepID=UPI0036D24E39
MTRTVVWSRDALDDLTAQLAYIAADNPDAAHRVAARIGDAGGALGAIPTGRPGRVGGTFEKSVTGLAYVIAYAITVRGDREEISILHVIHTARDWPAEAWPED